MLITNASSCSVKGFEVEAREKTRNSRSLAAPVVQIAKRSAKQPSISVRGSTSYRAFFLSFFFPASESKRRVVYSEPKESAVVLAIKRLGARSAGRVYFRYFIIASGKRARTRRIHARA